jgi:hypothetical protein
MHLFPIWQLHLTGIAIYLGVLRQAKNGSCHLHMDTLSSYYYASELAQEYPDVTYQLSHIAELGLGLTGC